LTSSRSEATRSFSFFDSQHALTQITVCDTYQLLIALSIVEERRT